MGDIGQFFLSQLWISRNLEKRWNHLKIQKLSFSGIFHEPFQRCRRLSYAVLDWLNSMSQPFDEIQYFLDQITHILACDKARMAHERSPKSSISEFSGDSISFQDFMIFIVAKKKYVQCPPCNAFLHSVQLLIHFKIDYFSQTRRTVKPYDFL